MCEGRIAVNCWVGREYVDKNGNIVKGRKRPKKSANKKARLIILGDCRTEAMQSLGIGNNVCNATIKPFNDAVKKAFPEQYLDCYSYLLKAGYYARDGQHYDKQTYKKIYNYIVETVGW